MLLTTCPLLQLGDALLGMLARGFVLLCVHLLPDMAKSISWDYNHEEMVPLVPEWSEPDTNGYNWTRRRAEFA